MRRRGGVTIAGTLGMACALAVTSGAGATYPGENGRIAFVSGRGGPAADDISADVYILKGPNGVVTPLTTAAGQHRHPDWAPDLEHIAYALWNGSDRDIWIHDLNDNSRSRATLTPAVKDDRPAFSHDGTRLAYEAEYTAGQFDILITDLETDDVDNLTDTPNAIEGKPVWSPDDQYIYYSSRPKAGGNDDIVRRKADGSGSPETIIFGGAQPVYQPALAPDGGRMCYTRGPFGSADADIYVTNLLGPQSPFNLSDSSVGAFNCAWSPNGQFVAYVNGVFTSGALVYEKADDSGSRQLLTSDTTDHFDGNPAWAPKHPALCQGEAATRVGTDGPDVIVGTMKRDVINGFGGADSIRGLQSGDLICGSGGPDTIKGGAGDDELQGGKGNDVLRGQDDDDTLVGGAGVDDCKGGPGSDSISGCE